MTPTAPDPVAAALATRAILLSDGDGIIREYMRREDFDILSAEVRRYQAMRCETCRHAFTQEHVVQLYCDRTTFRVCRPEDLSKAAWLLTATCDDLGNRCGAWARREP